MSAGYGNLAVLEHSESITLIHTLGTLRATRGKVELEWAGSGVGACKLKRGFSYLLVQRDTWVARSMLVDMSETSHIVSGIRVMLRRWGMGDAFQQRGRRVMLASNAGWMTDTDQLTQLLAIAAHHRKKDDPARALSVLNRAEKLCGGRYLPDYDAAAEYSIDDPVTFWQHRQKETLQAVAELRQLHEDGTMCPGAISAAMRALNLDRADREAYLFVARIARGCGHESLALLYERQAP